MNNTRIWFGKTQANKGHSLSCSLSSGGQVTAHLVFLASSLTPLSATKTSKRLFLLSASPSLSFKWRWTSSILFEQESFSSQPRPQATPNPSHFFSEEMQSVPLEKTTHWSPNKQHTLKFDWPLNSKKIQFLQTLINPVNPLSLKPCWRMKRLKCLWGWLGCIASVRNRSEGKLDVLEKKVREVRLRWFWRMQTRTIDIGGQEDTEVETARQEV